MKFRAGDMVILHLVVAADLFDSPFEANGVAPHVVSSIHEGETAVVVSLSNLDGRSVYIIGPHGAGWIFGAFLLKVALT